MDGDQGYPGDCLASASYSFSADGRALVIGYSASVTAASPVNLANHVYLNLAGHGAGSDGVKAHHVWINADAYTPVDNETVPTGEIRFECSKAD